MKLRVFLLLLLPATQVFAQADISVFIQKAKYESMKVSPDGSYLAFTQREGGKELFRVVDGNDFSEVSSTTFGDEGEIYNFNWISKNRLLLSPARKATGIDAYGPTGEIFRIDADGKNFNMIFGYGVSQRSGSSRISSQDRLLAAGEIIDILPERKNHVIIQSQPYGLDGMHNDAYQMDVRSGSLKELKHSPFRNGDFVTDKNHDIRFIYGSDIDNIPKTYYINDDDDLELIASGESGQEMVPMSSFGDTDKFIVGNRNENGLMGISLWDPATKQSEVIFHHDTVDTDAVLYDSDDIVWAISYLDHYPDYFYPDPTHPMAVLHQKLRNAFPDQDVRIVDATDDMSKVVVFMQSPTNPGDYVLLDVEKMQYLFRLPVYPDFPNESLSRMDAIELKARDGLAIRGYLTMPLDKPEQNLPMVVNVHGGPFDISDKWSFNQDVQLLASRGYAVLQVNFRGSGGRGDKFIEAGYGEWGGKMQDDVTDAVQWAINNGIADPDRVCIYGGSYGAFSALSGVVKEPDLFQCAIGVAGVYDIDLLFEQGDIRRSMRGRTYLDEVVGDDHSLQSERSPVENADRIKAAVMLVHGKRDDRAPIEHAYRMRKALQEVGNEPAWLVESLEGHGFADPENQLKIYEAVLAFLDEQIGH